MWIQPVLNTVKEIYFIDYIDTDITKNCHYIHYNPDINQFKGLSNKILIDLNDYIKMGCLDEDDEEFDELKITFNVADILSQYNKPLNAYNQVFYPADIHKIVFLYPNMYKRQVLAWFNDRKFYFRRHNVHFTLNSS